jgi:hypothetical protein
MLQLTGLLIEYLAIGSASLVWILLLIVAGAELPRGIDHPAMIALFLPLTYVLGMIGDFLGESILRNAKHSIQSLARKGTGLEKLSSPEIHARIVAFSPDLAIELNARSSRDRIARGIFVNVPFIGMATVVWFLRNSCHPCHLYLAAILTVMFTVLLTQIVYRMWRRFQKNSYNYEVFAYKAVEEKRKPAGSLPPSS